MHSHFFLKVWSHSLWDWISQSATWATLSLLEDLQNNCLANLFIETIEFDEELLRRNDLAETLKHWRVQD